MKSLTPEGISGRNPYENYCNNLEKHPFRNPEQVSDRTLWEILRGILERIQENTPSVLLKTQAVPPKETRKKSLKKSQEKYLLESIIGEYRKKSWRNSGERP